MVIVPFVSFIKEITPGSTSHRLEALSLPFLVRPFPNTDPIALTPTALPPRPATAADSIAAPIPIPPPKAKAALWRVLFFYLLCLKKNLP